MFERQVLRGFLANVEVEPPLVVTFRFNPSSIRDDKAVSYANRRDDLCSRAPQKEYTGGGDRTLSFVLELHGLERGSDRSNPAPLDNGISTELATLRSFLYAREDAWADGAATEGKRLSPPPACVFGFGSKILECLVTRLTVEETQFNSVLAPVRATVGVTLAVREEAGNALYELDRKRRNALVELGIQNLSPY